MRINKFVIKSLAEQKLLRMKDIAEEIGINKFTFGTWLHRGVIPKAKYDKLEIIAKLLAVDSDRLIIKEPIPTPKDVIKIKKGNSNATPIPFFDLDSQSALPILFNNGTKATPTDYIYIPGLSAEFIIPYYGKEMEPIVSNGDLIALRKITDHSFFNYGNIFLIATKEQIMVRYIKTSSKKNHITLATEKNGYEEICFPLNKIESLFMIISSVKRQLI